ncbi:MAG TPA: NAD-dependent epimerase/dehydratase family protein [Bryobacteraceae bacterium]|nr:NAD-dependent epimerase/dehydratase family protein [Bryobacteraceae bacterium]
MDVFLTGATGYIGEAVADALVAAGHAVTGLIRPGKDTRFLAGRGIRPFEGALENPAPVAAEAARNDALVHTAFDWGPNGGLVDAGFVDAALDALEGTSKRFLYTSGVWVMGDTAAGADEDSPLNTPPLVAWRAATERKVLDSGARGVRGIVIRPATVYGRGRGLVANFVKSARETGTAIIVGSGENYWSFVHIDDLARLYTLALDAPPGSLYIAASGSPLRMREVARAASEAAGTEGRIQSWVMDEAVVAMGPVVQGLVLDQRVSGQRAERALGWKPQAPSVLEELRRSYAAAR